MLPHFIICGAAKSGTTSLHHMLMGHPQLCLPMPKPHKNEVHFFDKEELYARGEEQYRSYFTSCAEDAVIGQTAPSYMYLEYVAERIHGMLPEAKLVFIMRNPIERAYSQYLSKVSYGREQHDFGTALRLEEERLKENFKARMRFSYFSRGMYADQVENFLRFFPLQQMFFLLTEDLWDPEQEHLGRLLEFLGVERLPLVNKRMNKTRDVRSRRLRYFEATNPILRRVPKLPGLLQRLNLTSTKPKMDARTRNDLSELYLESNQRLAKLIGRDLSHWNRNHGSSTDTEPSQQEVFPGGEDRSEDGGMRKLNVGAGSKWRHASWEVLDNGTGDYSLPWLHKGKAWQSGLPDKAFDILFTSHMLEHIPQFLAERTIAEFNRLLKSGGLLRISVPDLEKAVKAYMNGDEDFFKNGFAHLANHLGIGSMFLAVIVSPGKQTLAISREYDEVLGGYAHLYSYDFNMLKTLLEKWGFGQVVRSGFQQSSVEELREAYEYDIDGVRYHESDEEAKQRLDFTPSAYFTGFDNKEHISLFVEAVKVRDVPYRKSLEFEYNRGAHNSPLVKLKIRTFFLISRAYDLLYTGYCRLRGR